MAQNTVRTPARPKALARRGVMSAMVTAAGIFAIAILQQVLHTAVFLLGILAPDRPDSLVGVILGENLRTSLTGALPLAVGVFLSLWQIAPLGAELRLGHVITRSVLAAGIGAVLAALVGSVYAALAATAALRAGAPSAGWVTGIVTGSMDALGTAASILVSLLPVVVLGGVLLWLRLRHRDRAHEAVGMLDL